MKFALYIYRAHMHPLLRLQPVAPCAQKGLALLVRFAFCVVLCEYECIIFVPCAALIIVHVQHKRICHRARLFALPQLSCEHPCLLFSGVAEGAITCAPCDAGYNTIARVMLSTVRLVTLVTTAAMLLASALSAPQEHTTLKAAVVYVLPVRARHIPVRDPPSVSFA